MKSLVIIEVEHGETTDPLDTIMFELQGTDWVDDLNVINSTVRVDLPEHFVLESAIPVHYI
jgi:hypothetical protein